MRGASADIHGIYGPGLAHQLEAAARNDNGAPDLSDFDQDEIGNSPAGMPGQMTLRLKHKRQSALLRQILKSGGYGDLAKMAAFHKG